jgi:hypothetical protein
VFVPVPERALGDRGQVAPPNVKSHSLENQEIITSAVTGSCLHHEVRRREVNPKVRMPVFGIAG